MRDCCLHWEPPGPNVKTNNLKWDIHIEFFTNFQIIFSSFKNNKALFLPKILVIKYNLKIFIIFFIYIVSNSTFVYIYKMCKYVGMGRQWHPTPVLLPGKSHGQRSLVGCSPWGHKESDMTDRLHFHFSLSCIGEGNGNPLQWSCLENPRDGGAWWAAVYGVTQSWTQLKQLSRSSSSNVYSLYINIYISSYKLSAFSNIFYC